MAMKPDPEGDQAGEKENEEDQLKTGVSQDLIRLSVGLEDLKDLKADLKEAFKKVQSLVEK